jgi:DNA-binding protein HU-beta
MTKSKLVKLIQLEHKNLTQKLIIGILNTTFRIIRENIYKEEKFSYPGFGTFTIRARKERIGRDPRHGKQIVIKASKTIGFKPSKSLKNEIQDKGI